jgi:signal transduction histidine kinase
MSALTQSFLPGVALRNLLSNLLSNALKYSPGEELVRRFVSEGESYIPKLEQVHA